MQDHHDTACLSLERLEQYAADHPIDEQSSRHLASCSACMARVDALRRNNELLRRFLAPEGNQVERSPTGKASLVDGYELIEEIHRGGQGVVHRAVQKHTKRLVALKTLLAGPWASPRKRSRFEREIELVAALRHPGIVTLYDSGTTADGGLFFAMEYVDGVRLDDYARPRHGKAAEVADGSEVAANLADLEPILRLLCDVCDAVQHAHANGVIHRDLKPANILVDAEARPHVLDFGVARAIHVPHLGAADSTRTGEFMGTFGYAAPEQLSGDPEAVDARADVYSLGVILYELLTGVSPYETGGPLTDVIDRILHVDPPPPSRRRRGINDELDAIVQRAMAKDRDRRYATVDSLRNDIERYLAGDPVEARRDSGWYVLRKSVRRHRVFATGVLVAVAVVFAFGVMMLMLFNRARSERDRANAGSRELQRTVNALRVEQGRIAAAAGDSGLAEESLWQAHLFPPPDWELEAPMALVGEGGPISSFWALWELYGRSPCLETWYAGLSNVTLAEGGQRAAGVNARGELECWDVDRHARLFGREIGDDVTQAVLSTDGAYLAYIAPDDALVVVRTADNETVAVLPGAFVVGRGFAFDDTGERLAVVDRDMQLIVWDWRRGQIIYSRPPGQPPPGALGVAIRGDRLAIAVESRLEVIRLSTGSTELDVAGPNPVVRAVDISPDGTRVAAAFNTVVLVSTIASPAPWSFPYGGYISAIRFSHDGERLAVTGAGGRIRIADVERREQNNTLTSPYRFSSTLAFSRDDRTVVGFGDGTFRRWQTTPHQHLRRVPIRRSTLTMTFSPDGRYLAVGGGHRFLTPDEWIVDLLDGGSGASLRQMAGHRGAISSVSFDGDSRQVLSASYDATLRLWDAESGEFIREFAGHQGLISSAVLSPDQPRAISGGEDATVRVWDTQTGGCLAVLRDHDGRVPCVRFSADGSRFASCSVDGTIAVRDASTGDLLRKMGDGRTAFRVIAFSPDGRTIASGGDDRIIRIWDVASGTCRAAWEAHGHDIFTLAFHPDGRLLASAGRGTDIKLWDAARGRCLTTLEGHEAEVFALTFDPNGNRVVSGSADDSVGFWDLIAYHRHIAGNLAYQLGRPAASAVAPETIERLHRWASLWPVGLSPGLEAP